MKRETYDEARKLIGYLDTAISHKEQALMRLRQLETYNSDTMVDGMSLESAITVQKLKISEIDKMIATIQTHFDNL